jgi:hypothetical protein
METASIQYIVGVAYYSIYIHVLGNIMNTSKHNCIIVYRKDREMQCQFYLSRQFHRCHNFKYFGQYTWKYSKKF